jgi:hypothetical protein
LTNKQFKIGSWAKKLREELDRIALGYIWQDPQENGLSRTCKIKKDAMMWNDRICLQI